MTPAEDREQLAISSEMPIRSYMWKRHDYQGIDPGIRFAVVVLHARGIETCQSCGGGDGHAYDHPTVDLPAGHGDNSGMAALTALYEYGLPVMDLSLVWGVTAGLPGPPVWRITFKESFPDRADEWPMFAWHYQCQVDSEMEGTS